MHGSESKFFKCLTFSMNSPVEEFRTITELRLCRFFYYFDECFDSTAIAGDYIGDESYGDLSR